MGVTLYCFVFGLSGGVGSIGGLHRGPQGSLWGDQGVSLGGLQGGSGPGLGVNQGACAEERLVVG